MALSHPSVRYKILDLLIYFILLSFKYYSNQMSTVCGTDNLLIDYILLAFAVCRSTFNLALLLAKSFKPKPLWSCKA